VRKIPDDQASEFAYGQTMADQDRTSIEIALTRMTVTPSAADGEGERHLGELRTHHPARPAEARTLSAPSLRRIGRWVLTQLEGFTIAEERLRLAIESPSSRVGWWVAHMRLLRRPTVGRASIFALVLLSGLALLASLSADRSIAAAVSGAFLLGTLGVAIRTLWGDLVRLPYHAWRIRYRIRRSPWRVLPTTADARRKQLLGGEEIPPMVPRRELYYELLPGLLDRSRRDIQVIVGDPGSGKTTALVGISKMLARIGMVPVVVALGSEPPDDLTELARKRFVAHASSLLGSEFHLGEVWEWLRTHRRVVILADDLDRIAPDGERGFMVRHGLNELAAEGFPAVVTARPAGIPAGLAASAISLERLDERAAVDQVLRAAREEHGAAVRQLAKAEARGNVARWIEQGRFAEVPFYLDLLARLVAANRAEDLASPRTLINDFKFDPRVRLKADGRCEWNPLWVRFRLLERFYDEVAEGRVRRWLGIESRERDRCLEALSDAALSTLAASSLEVVARDEGKRVGDGEGGGGPCDGRLRLEIEQFLDPDDRFEYQSDRGVRRTVSAHEVVETGERLYILERDAKGKLLFKHRILQAYLAGRCLAGRLAEQHAAGNTDWHRRDGELDWLGALLDTRHPDRLTARMTLTFAALCESAH
jgi:hypothetical protein